MNKTLLHCCCAPCSVSCIQTLRAEGIEPVGLWYNPNIHPYQEYKARRDTLMAYAPTIGMELIVLEEYGLRDLSAPSPVILTTATASATRCGWTAWPDTPRSMASSPSPLPSSSAPTRTTS